ncbi:hypothetical protein BDP27DRAFT_351854 [Rhodocollybia butyracea]|uniref:Uncharacterized protein n=1 Tax=Rhodocollybia butyracea TaxID=206335 RepID=A0A9P5Q535_9AGAR|nr:hypothetical protein BDP27DRAFT_351854 [Rhodocollybia butyracea]
MVLCVTIFDYTERAAWTLVVDSWAIINSENALEYFSKSLFSATLEVDSKQNDPMVKLHDKGETDHLSNPIIQDRTFITKLKKHCHSIICGFDRQKRISEIHLCWSLNVLPPLARAEVKIGGIKSDLVKGKGVVANMKLNSVEGTGLRVSENAHSPWHCLDTSDQLYMWIGEFQKIFTHYRDNRRKWIQHASEVLSSASTAAVKDLQQYRQKSSGSADVLGNLELLARRVTDIEEHVRMEIVWLWEAHALLVTLFYLLARNARCYKDWSEHTGKIFSVELDAFQDRMKIHATRLLDDTNNLVNVFIAKRVILGGLNQEIQKLWTNSSSIDVLRADLDNQPRPPTAFHIMALWKEKLLLGIDQSEAKFSTIQRKLTSLLRPKLNKAGHDPTTILNALFTRARAPMKQRMDAEYGAAEARLHQILDFPITSYTSAEATSFVEKMIEAITPYTNSNITRLVDVTFNNRRHSHLDIGMTTNDRMPLEEFCQIIVRNQYASVISLGGEGYPQTGASTLRQCADALAQRSGTSSISIVMKNATFDNNAVDALLHAAKQNHRIVSLQLRHDLSIPRTWIEPCRT